MSIASSLQDRIDALKNEIIHLEQNIKKKEVELEDANLTFSKIKLQVQWFAGDLSAINTLFSSAAFDSYLESNKKEVVENVLNLVNSLITYFTEIIGVYKNATNEDALQNLIKIEYYKNKAIEGIVGIFFDTSSNDSIFLTQFAILINFLKDNNVDTSEINWIVTTQMKSNFKTIVSQTLDHIKNKQAWDKNLVNISLPLDTTAASTST